MNLEQHIEQILEDKKEAMLSAIVLAGDLKLFIKYTHYAINQVNFTFKPFHDDIINALQDIALGKNKKRNLGISVPVGAGKSLIVEYFIAWTFCRNINLAYLYTSHSRTNILKLSREVKSIFEHPFIIALFDLKLKDDEKSKINWSFDSSLNRTGLVATTTGSGSTGADSGNPAIDGYSGAVILDDPMDAGDINSQVKLDEVIRIYDDKLATRRRTPTTPSIVIMQRLCKNDLIGYLKKNQKDDWLFLEIPALKEDGESFWPERYPVNELKKIEKENPPKFFAQYQQTPVERSEFAIYDVNNFKYYDEIPQDIEYVVQSWDTAFKVGAQNDYSVCSTWAAVSGQFGYDYYILDVMRKKLEYPQLRQEFIGLQQKYNPYIILIEDKASGQSLIQDLTQVGNNKLLPVKVDSDKVTRATAPAALASSVYLPRQAGWLDDFMSEFRQFPDGDHDDIVDTYNQFLNWANKPRQYIGVI